MNSTAPEDEPVAVRILFNYQIIQNVVARDNCVPDLPKFFLKA